MAPQSLTNNLKRRLGKSAKRIARFAQYWGEDADFDMEALIASYRDLGMRIGENVDILACNIDAFYPELITIGDNVTITNTVILTHDDSSVVFTRRRRVGSVTIGSNVFIGFKSLILPGVTIGSNCIIGAGSVVAKDIPDNSIAVGVPAKVVKSIADHVRHLEADPFLLDVRVSTKGMSGSELDAMKREVRLKYRPDLLRSASHDLEP